MITTKNYYGNPDLLKKIRIHTLEENKDIDLMKELEKSFFGSDLKSDLKNDETGNSSTVNSHNNIQA